MKKKLVVLAVGLVGLVGLYLGLRRPLAIALQGSGEDPSIAPAATFTGKRHGGPRIGRPPHVYFQVDEERRVVHILAVWGAPREREPNL